MGGADGSGGEERRLEVLETRFDALEQLVGREQSECAQMWQIVEAAATSTIAGNADAAPQPAQQAAQATSVRHAPFASTAPPTPQSSAPAGSVAYIGSACT